MRGGLLGPLCAISKPVLGGFSLSLRVLLLASHLYSGVREGLLLTVCWPVDFGTKLDMKSFSGEWVLCAVCGCIPFILLLRPRWRSSIVIVSRSALASQPTHSSSHAGVYSALLSIPCSPVAAFGSSIGVACVTPHLQWCYLAYLG